MKVEDIRLARTLPIRWFNFITYPYLPDGTRRMTFDEFVKTYPDQAEWAMKLETENTSTRQGDPKE